MKFVPGIGQSDFRSFREAGFGYVDKTAFISEVLEDPSLVLLFPRPRRFGKTINLSALGYFLRKTDEDLSHLFEGLDVTRNPKAMAHFQKYPVLFLTFKDVKAKTFADTFAGIRERVGRLFVEHRYLLDDKRLDPITARVFQRFFTDEATQQDVQDALMVLSRALYEHHGQRVVILIDEYDTPIQSGYINGFFDDVVGFFRNFFSACLKDNDALFKGVLTGILRVSKENLFSGLNHIKVRSILGPQYSTSFGFTEEEVAAIIDPAHLEELRAWYDGYNFGGRVIYNPWSILNYIDEGLLKPYWVNTASSELIENLATKQGLRLSEKSSTLLHGETIEVPIDDNIVLRDVEKSQDALWSFLLFSGYLKIVELKLEMGTFTAKLAIPNIEVRLVYRTMFQRWIRKADPDGYLTKDVVQALLTGDAPQVQELLEQILLTAMSFQDPAGRAPEKLYHGFILGLLVHMEPLYDVRSNRESGRGRADVFMRPKTPGQPGVVMEFKVPLGKETPEQALVKAAEQVRKRQYATDLVAAGASPIYEYAMVFDGKQVWVKRVEDVLAKAAT